MVSHQAIVATLWSLSGRTPLGVGGKQAAAFWKQIILAEKEIQNGPENDRSFSAGGGGGHGASRDYRQSCLVVKNTASGKVESLTGSVSLAICCLLSRP